MKYFSPFIFSLFLCLSGCGQKCGPFPKPELRSVDASIFASNEEGSDAVASDLRLNLALGVRYVAQLPVSLPCIQTAYACSPSDPAGFDDEITELSLTCDKTIRGFKSGQNILTSGSEVFHNAYGESSITLGQWLGLMNEGEAASLDNRYLYDWREAYDINIAFIPRGTDAPAGNYTFTFALELRSGTRYTKSLPPVTIAALP